MYDDFFYCAIKDFDCLTKAVNSGIQKDFFYDHVESELWDELIQCFFANDSIDEMILMRWIKEKNKSQLIPRSKIIEIIDQGSKTDILRFDIILNQLIEEKKKSSFTDLLRDTHKKLTDGVVSIGEMIERHKEEISIIETKCTRSVVRHIDPVAESEQVIKDLQSNKFGYKFGYKHLDKFTNGIQRQALYTIGGRPGTGKTTFGMNVLSRNEEINTAFFSYEMTGRQCVERFMQIQNKNNKKWHELKKETIKYQSELLAESNIKIFDCNGKDERIMFDILNSNDIQLIVIDYLQSIKTSERFTDERLRINYLMQYINQLRHSFDVSILLLSQLNRGVDTAGGDLKMSHLKESGKIEEDSEIVMLLYHHESESTKEYKVIEGQILKNRYGSLSDKNSILFNFKTDSMNFYRLDTEK